MPEYRKMIQKIKPMNDPIKSDSPEDACSAFEVAPIDLQFECTHAVYVKGGDSSLCYVTSEQRGRLIVFALNELKASGKLDLWMNNEQNATQHDNGPKRSSRPLANGRILEMSDAIKSDSPDGAVDLPRFVSTREYGDPPTVAEVIEKLQKMPPDLRCYFRPKYHGAMNYTDEIPLHFNGICEMEPKGKPNQVTFLC